MKLIVQVDASYKRGRAGLGIAIRDERGTEIYCAADLYPCGSSTEGEQEAAVRGLRQAVLLGATVIDLETDMDSHALDPLIEAAGTIPLRMVVGPIVARAHGLAQAAFPLGHKVRGV